MTQTNIDEMPAGREMDALVGSTVFEWPVIWLHDSAFPDDPKWRSPYFWDESAKRTSEHSTQARLLGGYWLKGIANDGQVIEIFGRLVPAHSAYISPSWEVVEALQRLDFVVRMWSPNRQGRPHIPAQTWEVTAWKQMSKTTGDLYDFCNEPFENSYEISSQGRADTLPLAICRAALKAVMASSQT